MSWWEGRGQGSGGGHRAGGYRGGRGWSGWSSDGSSRRQPWDAAEAQQGPSGRSWRSGASKSQAQGKDQRRCSSAKKRLVAQRAELQQAQVAALTEALQEKPVKLPDSLLESGLAPEQIDNLRCVLSHDSWDDVPCGGSQWLKEWLFDGERWAEVEVTWQQQAGDATWCCLCRRGFSSEWGLSQHAQSKEHLKKRRTWAWRLGDLPPAALAAEGGSGPASDDRGTVVFGDEGVGPKPKAAVAKDAAEPHRQEPSPDEVNGNGLSAGSRTAGLDSKRYGAKVTPAQLLARARADMESLPAIAKKNLLQYRDQLSEAERRAVVEKIGLPRANDVSGIEALRSVFSEEVFAWICQVQDEKWLWREATFSWLSGFYWHPESTRLEQGGPIHTGFYCHLCEVECYDEGAHGIHMAGRRHAESVAAWVERMGATPVPSSCSRCPREGQATEEHKYPGDLPPLDIESCCLEDAPCIEAPEETAPPFGFTSACSAEPEPPGSVPYVAFIVRLQRQADGSGARGWRSRKHGAAPTAENWSSVKVVSSSLRIGARVGKSQKRSQWGVDLQEPLDFETATPGVQWRSLAVPLRGNGVAEAATLHFGVLLQHAGHDELEEAGKVPIAVPRPGHVAVALVEVPAERQGGWPGARVASSRVVPLRDFVASGQVDAFGGAQALRGSQRAFQLATEELMISFLLHFPAAREPAPVLIFLHGDLPRDSPQCPMPGLADFVDQYGPAELCGSRRRKGGGHAVRDFLVVTPCSPSELWWFRSPAVHDAKAYAPAVERWFRRLAEWLEQDLEVSVPSRTSAGPHAGLRLAGQSMGGYAALELARAMPELMASVACGAPCFDACRLDWLASRIRGVPLWVFIGRHDSMCSFEECASLVLKLRDCKARCVRLTSFSIKGHNEAFKFLEKPWLYRWLLHPLERT